MQADREQREHQDVGQQHQRVSARRTAGPAPERPRARSMSLAPAEIAGRPPTRAARLGRPPAQQAPGPQHQHHRHDDELGDQRELRVAQADAERLDLGDQQRGEECAGIEPRPPTTTTTKASDTTARSISRFAGSRGMASAPPSPASAAPSANTAGEQPALVDAERAGHFPVLGRGAHEYSPARLASTANAARRTPPGPSAIRNRSYSGKRRPAMSTAPVRPGARGPSRSSGPQAQSAKSLITRTSAKVASSCSSSGAR